MPTGQFNTPKPNKVIEALQRLGNQRPTGINLRVPGQSQHYLGTWLGAEAVDANLSIIRLHGGATIRFVPKLAGLTLTVNDVIKLEKSSVLPLHIVGKIVGNITLAFNQASNVQKPGAPTGLTHSTPGLTAIDVNWNAGVDHFGSGLTYQVFLNSAFRLATGAGALTAHINGMLPSHSYSCYVVAIDGAGNQSANSSTIGWTMKDQTPPSSGTTVTTSYKATSLRSYNYNGDWEMDSWHNGSCYQGAFGGSDNQIGLIFFDDHKMRVDTAGATMIGAKLFVTYAHWARNSGGLANLGHHNYTSTPGRISTARTTLSWINIPSIAGRQHIIDMGQSRAVQFQTGLSTGINVGQGPHGSIGYGYTWGQGTHVPRIELTYRIN